jgi:O-antigen/teichoic acid export membrane protein
MAAAGVLSARLLGVEDRGLVATATAAPAILAVVAVLGFGTANVYFIARRGVDVTHALGTSVLSGLVVGGAIAALYVVSVTQLTGALLSDLPHVFVVVGSLLIPATMIARYVTAVAQGLRRVVLTNMIGILSVSLTLILYTLLLWWLDLGPLAAVWVGIVSLTLSVMPAAVMMWREHGRWQVDRAYFVGAVRFGAIAEVAAVVEFLSYRVDLLIVSALAGFAGAGEYVVAFTVAETLWVLPVGIASVLLPRVAAAVESMPQLPGAESARVGVDDTLKAFRASAILAGTLGVALGSAAPILIDVLFGDEFMGAVTPLQLLLAGSVLAGLGRLISADLTARGRPRHVALAATAGLLLMIALDFLLIPELGVAGAALAASIGYASTFAVLVFFFCREGGPRVSELLPRAADARVLWKTIVRGGRSLFQRVSR